jgi:hypothetical protein
MNTILKLCGACIACAMLVTGTISANADIGRDDGTAKTASIGTQVALNPQPLPPRCWRCGTRHGGWDRGRLSRQLPVRPLGRVLIPYHTPRH